MVIGDVYAHLAPQMQDSVCECPGIGPARAALSYGDGGIDWAGPVAWRIRETFRKMDSGVRLLTLMFLSYYLLIHLVYRSGINGLQTCAVLCRL